MTDEIYREDFDTSEEFVAAKGQDWLKHDGCSETCRHSSHYYGVPRISKEER